MLVSVSAIMLTTIIKMYLVLIRSGHEDEELIKEYHSSISRKAKHLPLINRIIEIFLYLFLIVIMVITLYVNVNIESYFTHIPTPRTVLSDSMSRKDTNSQYLFKNELNNQFQKFDMIFTYALPDEYELQLYDIAVYERDGILVIHRIVGIEEPNEDHPDKRYFRFQGDAVGQPDSYPVLYSQMKGIYRNQRIPFLGSFMSFMQTPAGWLCLVLIVASAILTPIIEKILGKAKRERLAAIGFTDGTASSTDNKNTLNLH